MAVEETRLAKLIIKEHFGDEVELVVEQTLKGRGICFQDICENTNIVKSKVKQILSNLINQKLMTTDIGLTGLVLYSPILTNILLRPRYAKLIHLSKINNDDDISELIIETLLLNGCGTKSQVIETISQRYNTSASDGKGQMSKQLFDKHFKRLYDDHLLMETQQANEKGEPEDVPLGGKRKAIGKSDNQPAGKKAKSASGSVAGDGEQKNTESFWYPDFDRFHQLLLNENILTIAHEKIDTAASSIVDTMLDLSLKERSDDSSFTKSVSFYDIMSSLPKHPKLSKEEMQNYMSLLTDEKTCGIAMKTDDSGGGMYCINLKRCSTILCLSSIESIVQERLGSKACRVFRLLIQKKNLEQKQIGELAMIPFKEVKELLYKLFEERLVKIQELTKTGDFAPSRTFYLFSVDVQQVARLMLAKSYQALGNLMSRRSSEVKENKRLLEKNDKIEGILRTLSETGEDTEEAVQELDELITASEKQQLEKLKKDLCKLEQGELRVDSTIFLLKTYLSYQ